MSKFIKVIKSPHITIALAVGISIIALALFSKKVLDQPLSNLEFAIAPFIQLIYELLLNKHKDSQYLKPKYWVIVILVVTSLVIILHLI